MARDGMRHLAMFLILLPLPLMADPPQPGLGPALTADQFDAYATGQTLSYAQGVQMWGTEQYLPGRRVLWQPADQPCEYGTWFDDNGAICFVYEASPGPNCWLFYQGPHGLLAQYLGGTSFLSEVAKSPESLNCPGPMIGS
jgi:hypothetical protein